MAATKVEVYVTELDPSLATLQWFVSPTNEEESPEKTSTGILRRISPEPLIIAATGGKKIILEAKDIFHAYLYSDFCNDADETSEPTPDTAVMVYEIVENTTFAPMVSLFGVDVGMLCLTKSQISAFAKTHRQHLRTDGLSTFFLFKSKGKVFIADVQFHYFVNRHNLMVTVREFEYATVLLAAARHRIILPQL